MYDLSKNIVSLHQKKERNNNKTINNNDLKNK